MELIDIKKLDLKDGDLVIAKFSEELTPEIFSHLHDSIESIAGKSILLIGLGPGDELSSHDPYHMTIDLLGELHQQAIDKGQGVQATYIHHALEYIKQAYELDQLKAWAHGHNFNPRKTQGEKDDRIVTERGVQDGSSDN